MGVKFCAIDPSIACTGLAILEMNDDSTFTLVDKVSLSTKKTKYRERWDKKVDMLSMFKFYLKDKIGDISFFVFENYSYGSPGHLADLGELGGLFKLYLHEHKKSFDVIAPTSVKKKVTGKGRASKEEVQEGVLDFIVNNEAIVWNNFDESDAVAVGISYALIMKEEVDESE